MKLTFLERTFDVPYLNLVHRCYILALLKGTDSQIIVSQGCEISGSNISFRYRHGRRIDMIQTLSTQDGRRTVFISEANNAPIQGLRTYPKRKRNIGRIGNDSEWMVENLETKEAMLDTFQSLGVQGQRQNSKLVCYHHILLVKGSYDERDWISSLKGDGSGGTCTYHLSEVAVGRVRVFLKLIKVFDFINYKLQLHLPRLSPNLNPN